MPNYLLRCVYTLHFVATSIAGGLLLPALFAAPLARAQAGLGASAAPPILPPPATAARKEARV